ncbi:D-alanyl-D-alanine carboxypeptidase family protein [Solemya elarraichensis gill symbiont]|uniref:serine-type D-Ala-D-Ala carboxypeptidase n=1 Tax=Solemya elarraichensis gill symbiont TaxID=1918949 RepID=A0A1T2L6W4_9GAMM|nr:D-alanyl-D-alanine carboxypeptidase family protein [Solemya elarraichensis gill symbiont]OOZ40847.1 serine-type D-Ala-D-Ala carboxypeptidase [Solemya elarraichensis gill symbiont]
MHHFSKILIALFFLLVSSTAMAIIPPPSVASNGYLLVEMETGQVLAEQNASKKLEPASLTKIMTAHVVFMELEAKRISLSDMVLISEKAWRTQGSKMFIEVNKEVSVEDLLKGLIIQSGNDAAIALAEHVAGSEEAFATLMNQEAKKLGMKDSHFTNSSGLPDENHYTTARDIALVTMASIRDFPEYYKWYSQRDYTFNEIKQDNRNTLLWQDATIDGVKTGHTEAAGFCLVASAMRDGRRLVSVVMGAANTSARATESRKLLNYGFRFYVTKKLLSGNKPLQKVKVWKGATETIEVGIAKDLVKTIPHDSADKIKASLTVDTSLVAPISKGTRLGSVKVTLDDKTLATLPLIALTDVESGGIFVVIKDSVLLMLQ